MAFPFSEIGTAKMNDNTGIHPHLTGPLPVYGAWGPEDYAAVGLKVGLEIHQQLLTDHKLFCRCPAGCYTKEHDAEILRHMRPTLSEMGEYDGTALMEFKTRKQIIYLLKSESVCTYEMDDAPPFELNPQALDRSIAVSLLMGMKVVDEIHIARKQYLDGSIPTGFQRTAIIAIDGEIPFDGRTVRIRQLSLEEDSCREVSDVGHDRVYRTDRLGMPLIETVTDPDMRTPEEAAAVGQVLRRLVRITGLVRTGAGSARQDVNVSITGGPRIEIKGVSSLKAIPRLVHNEALRQRSLLAIREVLGKRGIAADDIVDRSVDVTGAVSGTGLNFLRDAIDQGVVVRAVPLPGFAGLLTAPTQPHTTFLNEISDRVRVIACLDKLPNLLCSTAEGPSLSSSEWEKVHRACDADQTTPVILVWGGEKDVATATNEILIRAREATVGVPDETRQSLPDGTNGFERILPGPNRMYPDTDLPPVVLGPDRIERIAAGLPRPQWERLAWLRGVGVGEDLARRLAIHPAFPLFERLHGRMPADGPVNPTLLASLLVDRSLPRPASAKAAGEWWDGTADRLAAGEIIPEAVWSCDGEPPSALPQDAGREEFAAALEAALRREDGLPADRDRRERAIMRPVMASLRGKVPGRTVRLWVKEAEL